ncbi:T9SS type A sorting domain-containing protein [candidate division WOR-3 bacterium]|nr:T9SS type A sorting domain-containing protein [candidate division WOR-3 bacterium]
MLVLKNLTGSLTVIFLLAAPGILKPSGTSYRDESETYIYEYEVLPEPEFNPEDSLRSRIRYTFSVANNGPGELDPLYTYLAIPVNRVHQELLTGIEFTPELDSALTDEWGLDFAYYEQVVPEFDTASFTYEVVVKTQDYDYGVVPENVGQLTDIPQKILDEYTTDGSKYDISNPVIVDAADQAASGETDFYSLVRNLHDFVTDTLHYDLDGRWDEAPQVLVQGHGSCTEYSWLMIALCRSKGIPARYVAGSYKKSGATYRDQVFHRWTEVYFPNYGWVSIDCTWDDNASDPYRYFGRISKNLFVTTVSGGPSSYLGWTYNSSWDYSWSGERPDYDSEMYFDWEAYWTGAEEREPIPEKRLKVFPNPAGECTYIETSLPSAASVKIQLYDLSGRVTRNVFTGRKPSGLHRFPCSLGDLGRGVYFFKLETDSYIEVAKIVVR